MAISDLTLYDFPREKLHLSKSTARQYVAELVLEEKEKLRSGLKQNMNEETKHVDYTTNRNFEDRKVRIGKGFRKLIIVITGLIIAFAGLGIAIIKLF